MIEFTISRVCMGICGLLLLAAVMVPVTGMYESRTVRMESDSSERIASLIDDFYYSKMEVFTISMGDVLPSTASYVEFDGHLVTLTTERGTYKSGTNIAVSVDDGTVFGHGDILRLSKNGDTVTAERLT